MNNVFQTDSIILTVEKLSGMNLKLILTPWCLSPTPGLLSPDVHLCFVDQGHHGMSKADS